MGRGPFKKRNLDNLKPGAAPIIHKEYVRKIKYFLKIIVYLRQKQIVKKLIIQIKITHNEQA